MAAMTARTMMTTPMPMKTGPMCAGMARDKPPHTLHRLARMKSPRPADYRLAMWRRFPERLVPGRNEELGDACSTEQMDHDVKASSVFVKGTPISHPGRGQGVVATG
jgi:hypothetical protein